jgi:hypothetical protein
MMKGAYAIKRMHMTAGARISQGEMLPGGPIGTIT